MDLSTDTFATMLSHIGVRPKLSQLMRISSVCTGCRALLADESVWQALCKRAWSIDEADLSSEWPSLPSFRALYAVLETWAPRQGFHQLIDAYPWGALLLLRFRGGRFVGELLHHTVSAETGFCVAQAPVLILDVDFGEEATAIMAETTSITPSTTAADNTSSTSGEGRDDASIPAWLAAARRPRIRWCGEPVTSCVTRQDDLQVNICPFVAGSHLFRFNSQSIVQHLLQCRQYLQVEIRQRGLEMGGVMVGRLCAVRMGLTEIRGGGGESERARRGGGREEEEGEEEEGWVWRKGEGGRCRRRGVVGGRLAAENALRVLSSTPRGRREGAVVPPAARAAGKVTLGLVDGPAMADDTAASAASASAASASRSSSPPPPPPPLPPLHASIERTASVRQQGHRRLRHTTAYGLYGNEALLSSVAPAPDATGLDSLRTLRARRFEEPPRPPSRRLERPGRRFTGVTAAAAQCSQDAATGDRTAVGGHLRRAA